MSCSKNKLMLYWSGELSHHDASTLETHLNGCSSCSRYLKQLNDLAGEIRSLPVISPKKNLIRAGLNRGTRARKRGGFFIPGTLTAAAAAVAACFMIWNGVPEKMNERGVTTIVSMPPELPPLEQMAEPQSRLAERERPAMEDPGGGAGMKITEKLPLYPETKGKTMDDKSSCRTAHVLQKPVPPEDSVSPPLDCSEIPIDEKRFISDSGVTDLAGTGYSPITDGFFRDGGIKSPAPGGGRRQRGLSGGKPVLTPSDTGGSPPIVTDDPGDMIAMDAVVMSLDANAPEILNPGPEYGGEDMALGSFLPPPSEPLHENALFYDTHELLVLDGNLENAQEFLLIDALIDTYIEDNGEDLWNEFLIPFRSIAELHASAAGFLASAATAYTDSMASTGFIHREGEITSSSGKTDTDAWSLWTKGFGAWGTQGGIKEAKGYKWDIHGGCIGLDKRFGNYLAGVTAGYSDTKLRFDSNNAVFDTENIHLGIFTLYLQDKWYLKSGLAYTRMQTDSEWMLSTFGFQEQGKADYASDNYAAYFGGGYDLGKGPWSIIPNAIVFYSRYDQNGYAQQHLYEPDLVVQGYEQDSLLSLAGLTMGYTFDDLSRIMIRGAWAHEFYDNQPEIRSSLEGSEVFSTKGLDPGNDTLIAALLLSKRVNDRYSFFGNYTYYHRKASNAYGLNLGIRFTF